jgi:hypothetical protein
VITPPNRHPPDAVHVPQPRRGTRQPAVLQRPRGPVGGRRDTPVLIGDDPPHQLLEIRPGGLAQLRVRPEHLPQQRELIRGRGLRQPPQHAVPALRAGQPEARVRRVQSVRLPDRPPQRRRGGVVAVLDHRGGVRPLRRGEVPPRVLRLAQQRRQDVHLDDARRVEGTVAVPGALPRLQVQDGHRHADTVRHLHRPHGPGRRFVTVRHGGLGHGLHGRLPFPGSRDVPDHPGGRRHRSIRPPPYHRGRRARRGRRGPGGAGPGGLRKTPCPRCSGRRLCGPSDGGWISVTER